MVSHLAEESEERTSPTLIGALCKAPRDELWVRFLEVYEPMLLDWARQLGFGEQAAGEVLSDVYCKLIVHLPTFMYDSKRSFRGWLRRVLQNAVADQRRRRIRKPMHFSTDFVAAQAAPECVEAESEFPEALSQFVTKSQQWASAVRKRVNEKTWLAFARTAIDGACPSDVAAELQMSLNSVYVARNRIQKSLQAEAARSI